MSHKLCLFVLIALLAGGTARGDSLAELSDSFWAFRAHEQPLSDDDIPRLERPKDFAVSWTARDVADRIATLQVFEQRLSLVAPPPDAPVHDQVNYRLLGSAIARVRWELVVQQAWRRDPLFYVFQSLGSVYALLLQPPPFSDARQHDLVARMHDIPTTLAAAKQNLDDLRAPFAELAITALDGIADRVARMEAALAPQLAAKHNQALRTATPAALAALGDYRAWLQTKLPSARADTAIGRDNYLYFLRNVALMPYSPEELRAMSRQEWARSVEFEAYQHERLAGSPPPAIFPNVDAQIEAERLQEVKIRQYLVEHRILSVPDWLQHYRNRLLPDYLEPVQGLGETDDLTGPSRLDQDGTSYIRNPRADLGFFYLSTARDPRPIIVHEGVPGHYFQLALGWHQADPIRRHYYDSSANEGIGFYAEEMMLQSGLFDDNAQTRATIYSFMRLRALRVEVDVKLALGEFTIRQAADYLERTVPMDRATAIQEAARFASLPGQAISYQIGKLQITQLLADVRRAQGKDFSLLKFHDFVWNNGNVPLSLQRWELLGDASDVPTLAPPGPAR